MTDGARTRDLRDHNPMLCQLSYDHQAIVQFYQPAPGVQKLGTMRGRSKEPLPRPPVFSPATRTFAWHRCAIGLLLNTGTRGPKSCRSARQIFLLVSKDAGSRRSSSGPTLLPIPRRGVFSFRLLTFAGGSLRPFGARRTPVYAKGAGETEIVREKARHSSSPRPVATAGLGPGSPALLRTACPSG